MGSTQATSHYVQKTLFFSFFFFQGEYHRIEAIWLEKKNFQNKSGLEGTFFYRLSGAYGHEMVDSQRVAIMQAVCDIFKGQFG